MKLRPFLLVVAIGCAALTAHAQTDPAFLLTATLPDLERYFPSYLANGYVSTITSPRGTEANPSYMVAFMDYTLEDIARPAAIPGWNGIDYSTGKSTAGEFWLNDVRLDDPSGPHVIVRFGARSLPTKSNKVRRVPLIPQAIAVMRRWLALLPTYAPDNPLGLAFPTPRGCRRDPGKLYGFHEQLKKAGITRSVRWHDLRHTCASSLVAGWWGKPWRLEEVRDLLGHSSVEVTERYAHLASSVLQEAANQTRGLASAQLRSNRDPRGSKSSEPRQKARPSGAVGQWFESTGARKDFEA